MFTFDGANKRIYIDNSAVINGTISFTPEQLWSRWIDWYLTGDNSKYPQALRITGGDPIGGGQYIGNYLFFRNDLGWRGVPPTIDGVTVIINGAFFGEDPTLPVMENNIGQETDLIINRSSMVTNTAAGGSAIDINELAAAIASQLTVSGLTQAEHDKLMSVATKGDVYAASLL